jgi:hypothetical protein
MRLGVPESTAETHAQFPELEELNTETSPSRHEGSDNFGVVNRENPAHNKDIPKTENAGPQAGAFVRINCPCRECSGSLGNVLASRARQNLARAVPRVRIGA